MKKGYNPTPYIQYAQLEDLHTSADWKRWAESNIKMLFEWEDEIHPWELVRLVSIWQGHFPAVAPRKLLEQIGEEIGDAIVSQLSVKEKMVSTIFSVDPENAGKDRLISGKEYAGVGTELKALLGYGDPRTIDGGAVGFFNKWEPKERLIETFYRYPAMERARILHDITSEIWINRRDNKSTAAFPRNEANPWGIDEAEVKAAAMELYKKGDTVGNKKGSAVKALYEACPALKRDIENGTASLTKDPDLHKMVERIRDSIRK